MIFTPVYGGGSSGGGTGVGALDFSFDGAMSSVRADDAGNWEFDILSSGALTFNKDPGLIDVFLVGGGGGSGNVNGAGGGYTTTARGVSVTKKQPYSVIIGEGGFQVDGGDTSVFDFVAKGGKAAGGGGGDGGSGGAGWGYTYTGKGGSNGSDGGGGHDDRDGQWAVNGVGIGQHTTTKAFEEEGGLLCSGGGGATGGAGGGGDAHKSGTDNLGGGAGPYGGKGGCGLVIIRNHREVAA